MDPQLEAFKKNKSVELVSSFNNTVNSLRSQLQSNINIIKKFRLHTKNKNKIIRFLNKK